MASAISANRAELLAIATAVATEKMIDKSIVIEAMEDHPEVRRNRYGAENDIRAKLDPRTGDLRLWRVVEVFEVVEDYFKQVDLKQAESCRRAPLSATSSSIRCPGGPWPHRRAERQAGHLPEGARRRA
jgi:N utilization substance protein A